MANLTIEERLLHYFLAMGAQQTESEQIPARNLAFVAGSDKIHVIILGNQEVMESSRVLETVLTLSSLKGQSRTLYLAAPRLLGTSIDAAIFKHHGIGLLLYDERKIDEAVPARPTDINQGRLGSESRADGQIVAELVELKSMYADLERDFAKLRDDWASFRRDDRIQNPAPPPVRERILSHDPTFGQPETLRGQLPPFFVNNPWLDVLSKRGRAGNDPIAG